MNIFLIVCFMSSALFGMETDTDSQPLMLNTNKGDFVAIDISASSFKESFKDAVNKDDSPRVQECLEQISKKFIPDIQLDPLVAGYLDQYFSLRSNIKQEFTDEYLLGVEESKQSAIIHSLMKLTKMRLQKATTDTLENYKQAQLKNRCREKIFLCCSISGACLVVSGFGAFAISMISYT